MHRLTIAIAAAFLAMGCAAEADELPAPALELTGRVVDAANIIGAETEAQLVGELETLESDTGVQLVVATTPSLEGRSIDAYSLDLANAWALGSAERNDGLMVLVAPTERQVRIEVGLGLEESVTDAEAQAIIDEAMSSAFRSGDFDGGIIDGVERLKLEVAPQDLKEAA